MRWTCKQCGLVLQNVRTRRVMCRCGAVDEIGYVNNTRPAISTTTDTSGLRTAAWELEDRMNVCRACDNFMKSTRNRCKYIDEGCSRTFNETIRLTNGKCPYDRWPSVVVPWYRTSRLVEMAMELIPRIPAEVDGVVGVPRSGMLPATAIATKLHLPLYGIVDNEIVLVRGGMRSRALEANGGRLAIVEDTVGSGMQLSALEATGVLRPGMFRMAVLVTAATIDKVDCYHTIQNTPHLLEWNFFNGPQVCLAGLDLDGVICEDGAIEVYDGGERELAWLRDARPLDVPRNPQFKTPAIVTARAERYRAVTVEWLGRHGAQYRELIMWPGDPQDRNLQTVADWKVNACRELDVSFYVESDINVVREMRRRHCRVLDMQEGCLR